MLLVLSSYTLVEDQHSQHLGVTATERKRKKEEKKNTGTVTVIGSSRKKKNRVGPMAFNLSSTVGLKQPYQGINTKPNILSSQG